MLMRMQICTRRKPKGGMTKNIVSRTFEPDQLVFLFNSRLKLFQGSYDRNRVVR